MITSLITCIEHDPYKDYTVEELANILPGDVEVIIVNMDWDCMAVCKNKSDVPNEYKSKLAYKMFYNIHEETFCIMTTDWR